MCTDASRLYSKMRVMVLWLFLGTGAVKLCPCDKEDCRVNGMKPESVLCVFEPSVRSTLATPYEDALAALAWGAAEMKTRYGFYDNAQKTYERLERSLLTSKPVENTDPKIMEDHEFMKKWNSVHGMLQGGKVRKSSSNELMDLARNRLCRAKLRKSSKRWIADMEGREDLDNCRRHSLARFNLFWWHPGEEDVAEDDEEEPAEVDKVLGPFVDRSENELDDRPEYAYFTNKDLLALLEAYASTWGYPRKIVENFEECLDGDPAALLDATGDET